MLALLSAAWLAQAAAFSPAARFSAPDRRAALGQPRATTPAGADAPPAAAAAATAAAAAAATATTTTAPAAAASPNWSQYSHRAQWYPLAFTAVTDKKVPHRVELFGEALVLWHDATADTWLAMLDECPHRLAPLSEGRVDEDGQIECPYHGWTFCGADGACTKIPQAVNADDAARAQLLKRAGGTHFRTAVVQGMVWVWGEQGALKEDADASLIPSCDAMEEDSGFVWIDISRDMPYSADMLLENVLDSSHVPFTHHNTISKRENGGEVPLGLDGPMNAAGFSGRFLADVPIGKQGTDAIKKGASTERTSVFRAPTYMHHRIRTAGEDGDLSTGFETWTVAYASPSGPGRSRLFARFPFKFPDPKRGPNIPRLVFKYLPDWVNHMGQLRVLDDDNIFLPLQERAVADRGGWKKTYYLPTDADTYVSAVRRWFDRAGPLPHAAHAVDFGRTGALDKAALLDRHAQHTEHCTSCSGALKNAKRVRKACKVVLIGLAATAPTLVPALRRRKVALAGLAVAAAAVGKVNQLAGTVETSLTSGLPSYPPPRNYAVGKKAPTKNLKTVDEGRRF